MILSRLKSARESNPVSPEEVPNAALIMLKSPTLMILSLLASAAKRVPKSTAFVATCKVALTELASVIEFLTRRSKLPAATSVVVKYPLGSVTTLYCVITPVLFKREDRVTDTLQRGSG